LFSSNNKTLPLVANSNLIVHIWHYNTIQHLTISAMPLHWFPSTPLFFHPSIPNITHYNIRGCLKINLNETHLLLTVQHMCHVPQPCVYYIILIGSTWLPQFHNGIIRDGQITSSLTAVSHSGHISNYLSAAGTALQFTAPKPPHSVQTTRHPLLNTIWRHTTLQLSLLICHTAQRATATENLVNITLYTIRHNALNCLQTLMDVTPGTAYMLEK